MSGQCWAGRGCQRRCLGTQACVGRTQRRVEGAGVDWRGRKKETNKTSLPSSCVGGQARQALVRADGAKDSPWVNAFQGNWGVSFVKSAH